MRLLITLFLLFTTFAYAQEVGIVCDNGETVTLPEGEDAQVNSWEKHCKPVTSDPIPLPREAEPAQTRKTPDPTETRGTQSCTDAYSYYAPELKTFLTITVREGQIIIEKARAGQIPLSVCFEVRTNTTRKTLEGIVLATSETPITIDGYTHTDGDKARLIYKDTEIATYPRPPLAPMKPGTPLAISWAKLKK